MRKTNEIKTNRVYNELFNNGRFMIRYKLSDTGILKYSVHPVFHTSIGIKYLPKEVRNHYSIDVNQKSLEKTSFNSLIDSLKNHYKFVNNEYMERDTDPSRTTKWSYKLIVVPVGTTFKVTSIKSDGESSSKEFDITGDELIRLG